jgi:hypothetical protein
VGSNPRGDKKRGSHKNLRVGSNPRCDNKITNPTPSVVTFCIFCLFTGILTLFSLPSSHRLPCMKKHEYTHPLLLFFVPFVRQHALKRTGTIGGRGVWRKLESISNEAMPSYTRRSNSLISCIGTIPVSIAFCFLDGHFPLSQYLPVGVQRCLFVPGSIPGHLEASRGHRFGEKRDLGKLDHMHVAFLRPLSPPSY